MSWVWSRNNTNGGGGGSEENESLRQSGVRPAGPLNLLNPMYLLLQITLKDQQFSSLMLLQEIQVNIYLKFLSSNQFYIVKYCKYIC